MGRLKAGAECTPATCGGSHAPYTVYAAYNLVGNETGLWDSSVSRYTTYDSVGRLQDFKASFNVSPPGTTGPGLRIC